MIELSRLPAEGLRLEGLEERISLDAGYALREIRWKLFLLPSGQDVFLEVKGHAFWEGSCCRCLEPLDLPMDLESQFLGTRDSTLAVRGAHTLGTQDLDVVFIPETHLDEVTLVREQFELQVPMHPLCTANCQGLCPQCGKNWNKGRCQCRPDLHREPGTLAKALSGLKLDLEN